MARNSKGTVKVKINEQTEVEVSPVLNFTLAGQPKERLEYLIMLGLKQRINNATRAKIFTLAPEVIKNCELRDEMISLEMDAEKIEKMFSNRPTELPEVVELNEDDVFPKRLTEDEEPEEESKPEPKKGKKAK